MDSMLSTFTHREGKKLLFCWMCSYFLLHFIFNVLFKLWGFVLFQMVTKYGEMPFKVQLQNFHSAYIWASEREGINCFQQPSSQYVDNKSHDGFFIENEMILPFFLIEESFCLNCKRGGRAQMYLRLVETLFALSHSAQQNHPASEATITPNVLNAIPPDGDLFISNESICFTCERWKRYCTSQTAPFLDFQRGSCWERQIISGELKKLGWKVILPSIT